MFGYHFWEKLPCKEESFTSQYNSNASMHHRSKPRYKVCLLFCIPCPVFSYVFGLLGFLRSFPFENSVRDLINGQEDQDANPIDYAKHGPFVLT